MVHDIPLLVETGQAGRFDVVVVVDAPDDVGCERLVARARDGPPRRPGPGSPRRRPRASGSPPPTTWSVNDGDLAALDVAVDDAVARPLAATGSRRS